jgi:FtsP/CotA-like multicopper oxidase with cupredoxin domain
LTSILIDNKLKTIGKGSNLLMDRRQFLKAAGAVTAHTALDKTTSGATDGAAHFSLKIEAASIELAPGRVVKTFCYNGQVPGPILRMREGIPVNVDVLNSSPNSELVHWHGLHIKSTPDGAAEEGSPTIAPGNSLRYSFTPNPAGTRWYHTHTMAMSDLDRATYTGQYGFLMIEPKHQPGRYDQEIFLAVHHWEPSLMRMNEGREECTGVEYRYASFNDKLLGAGEPIRVRRGERVLFHFLNASATEDVLLSLPGHRFTVLALDGNPVPNPSSVEVLSLAVAERLDAIVEMNSPGIWVLGSVKDQEREKGLGAVIEYANETGTPQWIGPKASDWSYALFSKPAATKSRSIDPPCNDIFTMVFEKVENQQDGIDRWTINGKPYSELEPLRVKEGNRYRFRFINASGCAHPVHLHRHSFELKRIAQIPIEGLWKDTINLERYNCAEADFLANNPGLTLFQCHQQLHMDYGFMQRIRYD